MDRWIIYRTLVEVIRDFHCRNVYIFGEFSSLLELDLTSIHVGNQNRKSVVKCKRKTNYMNFTFFQE